MFCKKDEEYAEAHWQVTANGKFVQGGRTRTIKRNGIWCVSDVEISTSEPFHQRPKRLPAETASERIEVTQKTEQLSANSIEKIALTRSTSNTNGEVCARKEPTDTSADISTSSSKEGPSYGSGRISTETSYASEIAIPMRRMSVVSIQPKHTRVALEYALKKLNWKEVHEGSSVADIWWYGCDVDIAAMYTKPGVYAVSRLPGITNLTQKINFSRVIKRMQTMYPDDFDFYPRTWYLPEQHMQFVGEARQNFDETPHRKRNSPEENVRETYIYKPNVGSQGDGIYLINDVSDLNFSSRAAVIQKYISNPLLIEGYKFDLRLYVVVSRLNPTEIYFCKDGLARFCTMKYERPGWNNANKLHMHLTNYTLNKYSSDFEQTDALHTGSKRTYKSIKKMLYKEGYDVANIHRKIVDLCNKVVLAMIPDLRVYENFVKRENSIRPFQILGLDILLTDYVEPILLEINSSPSLDVTAERETFLGSGIYEAYPSIVDETVKLPLVQDCLRLIAYGEDEMDENFCLERIYPPPVNDPVMNLFPPPQGDIVEQKRLDKKDVKPESGQSVGLKTFSDFDYYLRNMKEGKYKWNSKTGKFSKYFQSATANYRKEDSENRSKGRSNYPNLGSSQRIISPTSHLETLERFDITDCGDGEALQPDTCCGVCGNYMKGFGPSLCYSQDAYRSNCIPPQPTADTTVQTRNYTNFPDNRKEENTDFSKRKRCEVCKERRRVEVCKNKSPTPYDSCSKMNRKSSVTKHTRSFLDEDNSSEKIHRCTALNRAAEAFIFFSGVRPSLTISPNAFRNMVRRCELCDFLYLPTIDLMYMELMRDIKEANYAFKNNDLQAPKVSGLSFQGFLDGIFRIAKTHFDGPSLSFQIDSLLKILIKFVRKQLFQRRCNLRMAKPQRLPYVQQSIYIR